MQLPRFKLVSLLLLAVVVALPLGWLQARRLHLKRELAKLEGAGATVSVQDNGLWLTAPCVKVEMRRGPEGRLSIGGKEVSPAEASDWMYAINDQLRRLALAEKSILLAVTNESTGETSVTTMIVDDQEPPRMSF
jgi:hypothetical protein